MKRRAKLVLAALRAGAVGLLDRGRRGLWLQRLYSLVRVQRGRGRRRQPDRSRRRGRGTATGRSLFDDIRDVEDWTLNGPYLDGISFVTGLKNGKAI